MSFLVASAVALGTFVAGVIFSDKVKVWFKIKSADAVATTVRDVKAEETNITSKL